jgi:hypothetical protein
MINKQDIMDSLRPFKDRISSPLIYSFVIVLWDRFIAALDLTADFKTKSPIISNNQFRKEYKVSSDYYRPSIESLVLQ